MRAPRGRGNSRLQRIILAGVDLTLEVNQRTMKISDWQVVKKQLRAQAPILAEIASIMSCSVECRPSCEESPVVTPICCGCEEIPSPVGTSVVEKLSDLESGFDCKQWNDDSLEFSFGDPFWSSDKENFNFLFEVIDSPFQSEE
jgi:hypothetical protein